MILLNLDHQQDYLSFLKIQNLACQDHVLVLILTEFSNQDRSCLLLRGGGGTQDKTRFVVAAVMTNLVVRKLVLSLQPDWS